MELEADYGLLHARLIVAAIYTVVPLIALFVLGMMRTKPLILDQSAGDPARRNSKKGGLCVHPDRDMA